MYICKECGGVFDEYAEDREVHDELDGAPYESFAVCPYCSGTGFEDAEECEQCGEYFAMENGYIDEDGMRFCSADCALSYQEDMEASA